MGVKGLWQLLEPVGKPVTLESLEGKVLSVDASILLNQSIKGMRDKSGNPVPNAHLVGLFHRLCKLLFYRIKPVFVFDGGVPALKKRTLDARRERRFKAKHGSNKAAEKIIKNYLKGKALETVTGRKSDATLKRSSPREQDIFELPPMPPMPVNEAAKEDSSSDDEYDDSSLLQQYYTQNVEAEFQDPNAINVEAADFKALPEEIQHELIMDMKEARRWTVHHNMPEESTDFSSFQLQGVLQRGRLTQRLDQLRKDMNTRSSGDVAGNLGSEQGSVQSRRIVSEDTSHYVLIKGMKPGKNEGSLIDNSGEGGFFREEETNDDNTDIIMPQTTYLERPPKEIVVPVPNFEVPHIESSDSEVTSPLDVPEMVLPLTSKSHSPQGSQQRIDTGRAKDSAIPCLDLSDDKEMSMTEEALSRAEELQEIELKFDKRLHTMSGKDVTCDISNIEDIDNSSGAGLTSIDLISDGDDSIDNEIEMRRKRIESLLKSRERPINVDIPTKCDAFPSANIGSVEGKEVDNIGVGQQQDDLEKEQMRLPSTSGGQGRSKISGKIGSVEGKEEAHIEEGQQQDDLEKEQMRQPFTSGGQGRSDIKVGEKTRASEKDAFVPPEEPQKFTLQLDMSDESEEEGNEEVDELQLVPESEASQDEESMTAATQNDNKQQNDTLIDEANPTVVEESASRSCDAITQDVVMVTPDTDDEQVSKSDVEEQPSTSNAAVPVTSEFTGSSKVDLEEMQSRLEVEQRSLEVERGRQARASATVSNEMLTESQDLLQLFGVPFLVSPMEAEAQCAFLDMTEQTDGTITDDSDVFLFGGSRVYKNIFNQNKHTECYTCEAIQTFLALDRTKMIKLAFITGSDYTEGIQGLGAVSGMEVLQEFSDEGFKALEKLKEWHTGAVERGRTKYETKIKTKLRTVTLSTGFPSREVYDTYMGPVVDESRDQFEWARPDLHGLRLFALDKMGWSSTKTDELLLPVMKQISTQNTQTTMEKFFQIKFQETRKSHSKRVRRVVNRWRHPSSSSGLSSEEDDDRGVGPGSAEGRGGKKGKSPARNDKNKALRRGGRNGGKLAKTIASRSGKGKLDKKQIAFQRGRGRKTNTSAIRQGTDVETSGKDLEDLFEMDSADDEDMARVLEKAVTGSEEVPSNLHARSSHGNQRAGSSHDNQYVGSSHGAGSSHHNQHAGSSHDNQLAGSSHNNQYAGGSHDNQHTGSSHDNQHTGSSQADTPDPREENSRHKNSGLSVQERTTKTNQKQQSPGKRQATNKAASTSKATKRSRTSRENIGDRTLRNDYPENVYDSDLASSEVNRKVSDDYSTSSDSESESECISRVGPRVKPRGRGRGRGRGKGRGKVSAQARRGMK